MTKRALLTIEDGKRLARVSKAEGVAIQIEADGKKITVFPNIPDIHSPEDVDVQEAKTL